MKKDWKYVFREIVIVIIGIMIAFSLNNWSTNYQNSQALKNNLESIISDLEEDKISIDNIIARQKEKIDDFRSIKAGLMENEVDWDFLSKLISKQQSSPTFYPITSTFQSTVSSGKIDLIKNIEKKKKLFHLYEFVYKKAVYNGELYDQSHIEYYDKQLIKYIDFDNDEVINKEGIISKETLSAISYLVDEARDYIELMESLKKENEALALAIGSK